MFRAFLFYGNATNALICVYRNLQIQISEFVTKVFISYLFKWLRLISTKLNINNSVTVNNSIQKQIVVIISYKASKHIFVNSWLIQMPLYSHKKSPKKFLGLCYYKNR
jgi:hypothetical protein